MNENYNDVIIVLLRQPRLRPNEKRSDPFWEFCSFGCTRCHTKNLMNPKNADLLKGKRLAFAQGGQQGFRLVFLSPPIFIRRHNGFIEAKWKPKLMPFRYSKSPLLIDNLGDTDFSLLKCELDNIKRSTWLGKFSSAFRTRKKPVGKMVAREIVEVFSGFVKRSNLQDFAVTYEEAMSFPPPMIDRNRRTTYRALLDLKKKSCQQ